MKKILFVFLLLFVSFCAFAQSADNGNEQSDTDPYLDPIQIVTKEAIQYNAPLLSSHKEVKKYFDAFLPLAREVIEKLQKAQAGSNGLEDQFSRYAAALADVSGKFKKLKAPSDFKDFNDAYTKGLGDLSDWVTDMKGRIHYATSDYQRKAYAERLANFQKNWYDEFFGPALENLNSSWSVFVNYYWMDNLDPDEARALKKQPDIKLYLASFHHITYQHLRTAASLSEKARNARDEGDEDALIQNMQKEVVDLKKTSSKLAKLTPPPAFKNFHSLELNWLDTVTKGTQLFIQLETASENHESDEKLQELLNKKNQLDEQAKALHENVEEAYNEAMQSIVK